MNNNIDSLLDTVSKKLGITSQKLREAMQKGDLSIALQNMPENRTSAGTEKIDEKAVMNGGQL